MRNEEERCRISLTIEQQLKRYTDDKQKTERHEILWHAWNHNKHWLRQLQQWILISYPHYSQHDESHSMSILQNIEMLLGESQIRLLSASDCFLILHLAYIHDIGMCITYDDRLKLVKSTEFICFLRERARSNNGLTKRYAELLLTYCEEMPEITSDEMLLGIKLNIYYAIMYLISDFERGEHGIKSKNLLDDWVDKPEKLGIGFSTSGIPSRFFHTIASCASTHTSWDFQNVMNLSKEDSGFAHDYMHPRFAAIMLQLGDALDLDNDRFHPIVMEFLGKLPHESMVHMKKHAAIRRLRISPSKISIVARSDSAEVLRLVYQECNGIRDILRNAAFHWSAICPPELTARIPEFEKVRLFLNDQEIDESVVNSKFQIQQKKAFELLQGGNFYTKGTTVFLREIIQNAIDASKLQYWMDWKGSQWFDEEQDAESYTIDYVGNHISPLSYPIEIELHLARKAKDGNKYKCLDTQRDVEQIKESETDFASKRTWEYGVLIRIIDQGVGIAKDEIPQIADVGTAYEKRKDKLNKMPSWMQPTAEFGIGLQSVYLVSDHFVAKTRTHNGNGMEIEFCATGQKGRGFINTMPLNDKGNQKFGTTFEVFLSNEYKTGHQEDLDSWSGKDPFGSTYEEERNIRHARELVIQLAYYINSIIGEKIFPIKLYLYDYENASKKTLYTKAFLHELVHISYQIVLNGKECQLDGDDETKQKKSKSVAYNNASKEVTWAYRIDKDSDWIKGSMEGIYYVWDLHEMKLYLWDEKHKVCARFGSDRIQARREKAKNPDLEERKTNTSIYYKGVYAMDVDWRMDADLLEYIDIKEKLKREYITLGRDFFTEEGEKYVQEVVYKDIVKAVHKVLEMVEQEQWETAEKQWETSKAEYKDSNNLDGNVGSKGEYLEKNLEKKILENAFASCDSEGIICSIWRRLSEMMDKSEDDADSVQGFILAVVGFAGFAQIRSGSTYLGIPAEEKYYVWSCLLEKIAEKVEEKKNEGSEKPAWIDSTFFNIETVVVKKNNVFPEKYNIAKILNHKKKFAVVSQRASVHRGWREYLLDVTEIKEPDLKEQILKLKTEWDWETRKGIIDEIERWGESLKKNFQYEYKERLMYGKGDDGYSQDMILRWLLDKVPSIALFSTEDSTIRINVLDLEHTDSMYFDVPTKWSIYKRMLEYHENKGIERFSAIAPTGYCQMAVDEQHPSVYFVKRGLLAKIGQRYMIMPFTGETLKWLFEERRKIVQVNENNKLYEVFRVFFDISECLREEIKSYRESIELKEKDSKLEENSIYQELVNKYGALVFTEIQIRLRSKLEEMSKQKKWGDDIKSLLGQNEGEQNEDGQNEGLEKAKLREKLPGLLKYIFDIGKELEDVEDWVKEKILPRYYVATNSEMRSRLVKGIVQKETFREELLCRCGLSTKKKSTSRTTEDDTGTHDDINVEDQNSTKKLVTYIAANGWTHVTEEQLYRFLQMFISETAEEMERFCNANINEMLHKIPMLFPEASDGFSDGIHDV